MGESFFVILRHNKTETGAQAAKQGDKSAGTCDICSSIYLRTGNIEHMT